MKKGFDFTLMVAGRGGEELDWVGVVAGRDGIYVGRGYG